MRAFFLCWSNQTLLQIKSKNRLRTFCFSPSWSSSFGECATAKRCLWEIYRREAADLGNGGIGKCTVAKRRFWKNYSTFIDKTNRPDGLSWQGEAWWTVIRVRNRDWCFFFVMRLYIFFLLDNQTLLQI